MEKILSLGDERQRVLAFGSGIIGTTRVTRSLVPLTPASHALFDRAGSG
jgi:hypothetical protein